MKILIAIVIAAASWLVSAVNQPVAQVPCQQHTMNAQGQYVTYDACQR